MRSRRKSIFTALMGLVLGTALVVTLPASASHAQSCNGYVGLTFDDGPYDATTRPLVDALTANGLRATFFNTGKSVEALPGLTRYQRDARMWIGSHSYRHGHLDQWSESDMADDIWLGQRAIRKATGTAPRLFRPPFGDTNSRLKGVEADFGLTEVLWDIDSRDWAGVSSYEIARAARGLDHGEIIVMHDGDWDTIRAIPRIAADLRSRGLCSGKISTSTGNAVAP